MKKLYLFNPETDLALAANSISYTPPTNVVDIKRRLFMLPSLYAEPNSLLLVPSISKGLKFEELPYYSAVEKKNIRLVSEDKLMEEVDEVIPWGWNMSEKLHLKRIGLSDNSLPADDVLSLYRELSHRKQTISFHRHIKEYLGYIDVAEPLYFENVDDALKWAMNHKGCYLKAPWSSSGRGVFCVSGSDERPVKQWMTGIVNKQGGIMAEEGVPRRLDFATEWILTDSDVKFLGYSVFSVGSHGAYQGNILCSQDEFEAMLTAESGKWSRSYIDAQRDMIESRIAPFYKGPIGIDMLIGDKGEINPCVEVNLRMTMGHVALALYSQKVKSKIFIPGKDVEW